MNRFKQRPTSWEELENGYAADIMQVTRAVADAVREALPGANEQVKGALKMGYVDYWTDDPKEVLARISPGDDLVRLYVHHIKADPSGRLKVEGTGKGARHVKVDRVPDRDAVVALVRHARDAYQGSK